MAASVGVFQVHKVARSPTQLEPGSCNSTVSSGLASDIIDISQRSVAVMQDVLPHLPVCTVELVMYQLAQSAPSDIEKWKKEPGSWRSCPEEYSPPYADAGLVSPGFLIIILVGLYDLFGCLRLLLSLLRVILWSCGKVLRVAEDTPTPEEVQQAKRVLRCAPEQVEQAKLLLQRAAAVAGKERQKAIARVQGKRQAKHAACSNAVVAEALDVIAVVMLLATLVLTGHGRPYLAAACATAAVSLLILGHLHLPPRTVDSRDAESKSSALQERQKVVARAQEKRQARHEATKR
eukprot:gnl/TRDRNA2_/TRDRNA2_200066_c0_seq1.p1 gnl/TRDRNA2_/TRDRNA2_200066_c0~~gnl/TRDRNA2_/TRDRNA2_200066_c0_seq1.p1  ORF type:complete len:327 (-),score=52.26 gnl/TRDRNA2_/TRDRNA2_200066_c0_seq1:30-905(-)